MKNISRLPALLCIAGLTALVSSCFPDSDAENLEIGTPPEVSFTVTPIAGKTNTYLLTATGSNAFIYRWNIGDGSDEFEGTSVDTAYYAEKGSYTIKLLAVDKNGYDTSETDVTVIADDPEGCFGAKKLLTGCSSKTWVLDQPGAGALFVGPPGLASAWWSNSAGDVTDASRVCLFDDEYTFSKSGNFGFEVFGDMRVDDENSNPWPTDIGLPIGCHDMSVIPAKYQAWGSGNHKFKIIGGNKLQVIGTGAHLGLYKVGENGTTDHPEESVTYDIVSITETKLVVKKEYSWGGWRFTFKVKE